MFFDLPPQLPDVSPHYVQVSTQIKCPTGQSTKIDVRWNSTPVKYDFSKSSAQLEQLPMDTKNPYGTHVHTDRGGLANGIIQISSSISTKLETYPALNQTCQWIDRVALEIKIDQTVYIAREHKPGSCMHKSVLEHETKHVKTDQRVVQDYVPKLKQAVAAAVAKIGVVGPKPDAQSKDIQIKMQGYIKDAIASVNTQMNTDRKARQQAVDSLQEYQRVSNLCR